MAAYVVANPRYIIQLQPGAEVLAQFLQQDSEIAALNLQISQMSVIKTISIGDFQAVVTELDPEGVERAKQNSHVHDILADFEVRIFGKRDEGSDVREPQLEQYEGEITSYDYDTDSRSILSPDPIGMERKRLQAPPPDPISELPVQEQNPVSEPLDGNDYEEEEEDEEEEEEGEHESKDDNAIGEDYSEEEEDWSDGELEEEEESYKDDEKEEDWELDEDSQKKELDKAAIDEEKQQQQQEQYEGQTVEAMSSSVFIPDYEIQQDAPGHLSRISFQEGLYFRDEPYEYLYDKKGSGITVYILDTGIAIDHPEFEGRAIRGGNFIIDEPEGDQHGHGTHVAGLVGSKNYGVAKNVTIVEVKVLGANGGGAISSILSGIEFAVNQHKKGSGKSVVNLSLGSLGNPIIDEAVNEAYKQGVVMVCAAGNSNIDVSFTSPARARGSFTVGALDTKGDTIAIFSNYGKKTDIFAPGVGIMSLNHKDFENPIEMSGTSMAAPIVAGLVATVLEEEDVEPEEVRSKLIDMATKDEISIKGLFSKYKYQTTPNRIAFNGLGDADPNKRKLSILEPTDNIFDQDQALLKYVQDLNEIDVVDRDLWERSNRLHLEREGQDVMAF